MMIPLLLVTIGNFLPFNSMVICGSQVNWPFLIPTMDFICCSSFTSYSYILLISIVQLQEIMSRFLSANWIVTITFLLDLCCEFPLFIKLTSKIFLKICNYEVAIPTSKIGYKAISDITSDIINVTGKNWNRYLSVSNEMFEPQIPTLKYNE